MQKPHDEPVKDQGETLWKLKQLLASVLVAVNTPRRRSKNTTPAPRRRPRRGTRVIFSKREFSVAAKSPLCGALRSLESKGKKSPFARRSATSFLQAKVKVSQSVPGVFSAQRTVQVRPEHSCHAAFAPFLAVS